MTEQNIDTNEENAASAHAEFNSAYVAPTAPPLIKFKTLELPKGVVTRKLSFTGCIQSVVNIDPKSTGAYPKTKTSANSNRTAEGGELNRLEGGSSSL